MALILKPSHAHRWLHCLNAPLMESVVVQPAQGEYAADGVRKHLAVEAMAIGLESEDEDVVKASGAVTALKDRIIASGYAVREEAEKPFPLESITGESGRGRNDLVLHAYDRLGEVKHKYILDYKFGHRKVEPVDNPQLIIGALGELNLTHWNGPVTLGIVQPAFGDEVSEWETTSEEIKHRAAHIKESAEKAIAIYRRGTTETSAFAPSEGACRYCAASGACKARKEHLEKESNISFENPQRRISDADILSDAELARLYQVSSQVEDFFKALKEQLYHRLTRGASIEGVKLVKGRKGNLSWKTQASIEKFIDEHELHTRLYEESLVSPTRARPRIPKELRDAFDALTYRAEAGLTMAKASDSRPEAGPNAVSADEVDGL